MVKRPDNAIAEVDIKMLDGRFAFDVHVTVKDLRRFWKENRSDISYLCFNIGMTGYFWSEKQGWHHWSRYQYRGGKPTAPITRDDKIWELAGAVINRNWRD